MSPAPPPNTTLNAFRSAIIHGTIEESKDGHDWSTFYYNGEESGENNSKARYVSQQHVRVSFKGGSIFPHPSCRTLLGNEILFFIERCSEFILNASVCKINGTIIQNRPYFQGCPLRGVPLNVVLIFTFPIFSQSI